ncbi:MAG: chromosome segregation protein SMC [Gammaproteobacteria bacterium]
MKISHIKLSGFKSFVDPTTLHLSNNLTGIVGPNGCGKSNIVDAVLWVMGEISAKHLRGDSMADVIFNGSNSRKPVGQATVELVFDNSEGGFLGQYAGYAEIAIKRQVARDGGSDYFLNGVRCRRKDITDLFLGTGLGSRSYAVIEQGMISRVVEAKPEELRVFLEEAAGISRYKERRKETEARIRDAQGNIARLTDLRDELDKQLSKLQHQARAAEMFQRLRDEERRLRAESIALAYRELERESTEQRLVTHARAVAVDSALAQLRAIELAAEQTRQARSVANDNFNQVQARYYSSGAEIARLEQAIQHAKDRQRALEQELERLGVDLARAEEQTVADEHACASLKTEIEYLTPQYGLASGEEREAGARLLAQEAQLQTLQGALDAHGEEATQLSRAESAEGARVQHLSQSLAATREQLQRLRSDLGALASREGDSSLDSLCSDLAGIESSCQDLQARKAEVQASMRELRERRDLLSSELNDFQTKLQAAIGRRASLEALRDGQAGVDLGAARAWLESQGVVNPGRVVQDLAVDPGWEAALEMVLGDFINAFKVKTISRISSELESYSQYLLCALETADSECKEPDREPLAAELLLSRVREPHPITCLLGGVYLAEDVPTALSLRPCLRSGESVVTRGGVWLGCNWMKMKRAPGEDGSALRVQKDLNTAAERERCLADQVDGCAARMAGTRQALAEAEEEIRSLEEQLIEAQGRIGSARERIAARQAEDERIRMRNETLVAELRGIEERDRSDAAALEAANVCLQSIRRDLDALEARRAEVATSREQQKALLQSAKDERQNARERMHEMALRLESTRARCGSLEEGLNRNRLQIEQMKVRRDELLAALGETAQPNDDLKAALQHALEERLGVEAELAEARADLQALDAHLREGAERRAETERGLQELRDALEQARLHEEALRVRMQTQHDLLAPTGHSMEQLLTGLPAEAEPAAWQERLSHIESRIGRLGPINLAAVDECEQLRERKKYLDDQNADLSEALATLDGAIRRMDRETRGRFKEVFEAVNSRLQSMFPRLFGGGHAYLELTDDDLLATGISLMARPPGKRNTTVHLLSGGEKALTALALVFAIFELNPAPFCLLDEVDAPLDDANAVHLCDMLRSMSESVQFLFVTHNKTTMEIAERLIGVTMQEAGVSRLVAVDIDAAMQLAATA